MSKQKKKTNNTYGFVYVLVGSRDYDHLSKSIAALRTMDEDGPIRVYHEKNDAEFVSTLSGIEGVEYTRSKYPEREENRNSSLWRLKALKESPWEVTCYLDNDIYVVHQSFWGGFKISGKVGMCMVENPRLFIKDGLLKKGDLDIGTDVNEYDKAFLEEMPPGMTALNMGIIFCTKKPEDQAFLDALIEEQEENPSRGQAGLYRTIWKTGFSPYTLTRNWLVCKYDAGKIAPVTLHAGHPEVIAWWNAFMVAGEMALNR